MYWRHWSKLSCYRYNVWTTEPKRWKCKNIIVGYGRISSVAISGELEILPKNTEMSVKIQEVKIVPNITKNIVSVGVLLQDGDEMEVNLGIYLSI